MSRKSLWQNEEGATAVIAAIAFTLTIVMCGLVVDMGTVYNRASSMQTAADAAVYAAAGLLPISIEDDAGIQQVQEMAESYAEKNGMESDSVDQVELMDVVNGMYTAVRVQLQSNVPYYFGAIIGLDNTTVIKSAKARVEAITAWTKMVPLGISVSKFNEILEANGAQSVIVKYGGGDGDTGFYGALDLDGLKGGGAQDFSTWLAFGYDGELQVGDVLPVEPGNMSDPTTEAFMTRYSQCTHFPSQGGCNAEHYDANCPRVVYLIVYTLYPDKTVEVEGFAPFVLEGMNDKGEITASFVRVHTQQGKSEALTDDTIDCGIYHVRLIE